MTGVRTKKGGSIDVVAPSHHLSDRAGFVDLVFRCKPWRLLFETTERCDVSHDWRCELRSIARGNQTVVRRRRGG